MSLHVGLISGTSMDGIDAALVDIKDNDIRVVDFITFPYSTKLAAQLTDAIRPDYRCSIHELATLDINVGREFSNAANELLLKTNTNPRDVVAIGSHGQTVRHSTDTSPPYSLQIGHGAVIANDTRIDTVCDFRSQDIVAGGQGAPLVPAFHESIFRSRSKDRVVVNIGGISNITVLPADVALPIQGFDTGPGNCLMDEWCRQHRGQPYDENGDWAASGKVSEALLDVLLDDPFLKASPPKSAGREYYNVRYLENAIKKAQDNNAKEADVQTTLVVFTARAISDAIKRYNRQPDEVIVCGGGARNSALRTQLGLELVGVTVKDTSSYGICVDAVEGAAFAWFACQRINNLPIKLPSNQPLKSMVLGCVYMAP